MKSLLKILDGACRARTVEEALNEIRGFTSLGHNIFAYAYLRILHYKAFSKLERLSITFIIYRVALCSIYIYLWVIQEHAYIHTLIAIVNLTLYRNIGQAPLLSIIRHLRCIVEDSLLFYRTVLAEPALLMPIVYTPTVGEACQKFGQLPLLPRGCP